MPLPGVQAIKTRFLSLAFYSLFAVSLDWDNVFRKTRAMAEQSARFVRIGKWHFNLGAIPCIEEGDDNVTVHLGGAEIVVLSGNDAEALLLGIHSEDLLGKLEIEEIARLNQGTREGRLAD